MIEFTFQVAISIYDGVVFGLWSLVFGLWPLAFGLWPFVLGF